MPFSTSSRHGYLAEECKNGSIPPSHMTSLWVQPMPKVSITVVETAMRVTEKAQKRRKMARIWPFLSHRRWFMAPKIFSHQCLLVPIIWSDFLHFRRSGSIVCWKLLHTFTDVMKGASPFLPFGFAYLRIKCKNYDKTNAANLQQFPHICACQPASTELVNCAIFPNPEKYSTAMCYCASTQHNFSL